MQQLDAWYTFKRHTMHLDDMAMRERLVTFIKSTPDPFAVEITYHRSCWKKYAIENLYKGSEQTNIHLHDVQLSEVQEILFHHIRTVIFEQHELHTLLSLFLDYTHLLQNFELDGSVVTSSTMKKLY